MSTILIRERRVLMKNFKLGNKKLLSFILTGSIVLSGCNINVIKESKGYTRNPIKVESTDKSDFNNEVSKNNETVDIQRCSNNVCASKTLKLKSNNTSSSKTIRKIGKLQKAKELGKTKNGWSLIKYKGKKGFVESKDLKDLGDTYIEIDISSQKMIYYKNGKKILSTSVVTGKNKTPTVKGLFSVYSKNRDYTMRGVGYTSHSDYVLKFYNAYYIHDSSWRSNYGGNIYKYNGSHGCVNTPYKKVKKLYENTSVGTKVLIHK